MLDLYNELFLRFLAILLLFVALFIVSAISFCFMFAFLPNKEDYRVSSYPIYRRKKKRALAIGILVTILITPPWMTLIARSEQFDDLKKYIKSPISTTPKLPHTRQNIGIEYRRYRLVDQKPPTYYIIQLEDVITKDKYWLSVSKYCEKYQQNKIGQEYNLPILRYKYIDDPQEFLDFQSIAQKFC